MRYMALGGRSNICCRLKVEKELAFVDCLNHPKAGADQAGTRSRGKRLLRTLLTVPRIALPGLIASFLV
jgi:hypothetical protein